MKYQMISALVGALVVGGGLVAAAMPSAEAQEPGYWPGHGWGGHFTASQERKQARFKSMDTDKEGKVSKAEFIDGGRKQFEAADADKDGKVTPWEFRAARRF